MIARGLVIVLMLASFSGALQAAPNQAPKARVEPGMTATMKQALEAFKRQDANVMELIKALMLTNIDGTLEQNAFNEEPGLRLVAAPLLDYAYRRAAKNRNTLAVHVEEMGENGLIRGFDTTFSPDSSGSWQLRVPILRVPTELTIVAYGLEHHFLLQRIDGVSSQERWSLPSQHQLVYCGSLGVSKSIWRYKN